MNKPSPDNRSDPKTVTSSAFELDTLQKIAENIARETGEFLHAAFIRKKFEVTTKTTPTDLVSDIDVAAEDLIRKRLDQERPDDSILGEEHDAKVGSTSFRWIIDPLDGTVNFVYGIPQWSVSIACENARGQTLIGVVYDPMRDELWSAQHDGVATLNGEKLIPSEKTDLSTAMVVTGFGYDAQVRKAQGTIIAQVLPLVRDIRRLGSAALDLAWTAGGRYDIYYENDLKHWDVAAGALICERVGLKVRPYDPPEPLPPGLIAGPAGLVNRLIAIVG